MSNDLRRWRSLCELRHGGQGVPDTLYHGTDLQSYLDIRASDVFEIDPYELQHHGFSTTEDESVAIRFARMAAAGRSGDRWGVVLSLDGTALASRYTIEAYDDDDEHHTLGDHYEWEWVILSDTGTIAPAKQFITNVAVIDTQGDPSALLSWDEAVHGIDPRAIETTQRVGIAALRKTYTIAQAGAALLVLARKIHPDQPSQSLRTSITKLGDDVYRMLWLYLRRKS